MAWSKADIEKLLSEVLDAKSIQLICSQFPDGRKHKPYLASNTPPEPRGCVNCWQAYWMYSVATTPPHLRAELLEKAYRGIYDAVKSVERGEFDFQPLARPGIVIEHDAYDEATGIDHSKAN